MVDLRLIGVPDGNVYPLMTALKKENSRTKVYGWVAGSVNASTSANNNFPVSYDIFPNRVELNQAVVYMERLPDTVQKGISRTSTGGFTLRRFTGLTTGLLRRRTTSASSFCRRIFGMGSIRCLNMRTFIFR